MAVHTYGAAPQKKKMVLRETFSGCCKLRSEQERAGPGWSGQELAELGQAGAPGRPGGGGPGGAGRVGLAGRARRELPLRGDVRFGTVT